MGRRRRGEGAVDKPKIEKPPTLMVGLSERPNPVALKLVEDLARQNKTYQSIAVRLGITWRKFKKLLDDKAEDNPWRLHYERGRADHEQKWVDHFEALGRGDIVMEEVAQYDEQGKPMKDAEGKPVTKMEAVRHVSKAGVIAGIFYAKTQLGWREADRAGGGAGQGGGVTIVLPRSLTAEEWGKRTGVTRPIDTRKGESIMDVSFKEVSSGVPALPAPSEPANGND